MAITKEQIQELRERTGCGMLDCKKALEESNGDMEKAVEQLRKKGAAIAAKRGGNKTAEGLVHAYIHPGAQVGVLLEINCETDFVARTESVIQFAQDICLHIAAMKPLYLRSEDVDQKFLEHEKTIIQAQLAESGKPEKIVAQIADGKLKKIVNDICLLQQPFVKNDQLTVDDVLKALIAKIGENIVIRRFVRYEIGL
ncbi:MAG: translation elongation factor Ts [Candidatus Babeliales bacterium]